MAASTVVELDDTRTTPNVVKVPSGLVGQTRPLKVAGAVEYIAPGRYEDERGFFEEIDFSWIDDACSTARQCSVSGSHRNVLRGIHCSPYAKVITCTSGEMWDVVVDLRKDSPTFLKWDYVLLSPERRSQLFVPANVGHGFLSLQDNTTAFYIKFGFYAPGKEMEVNAFDPTVGICWPTPLDGDLSFIRSPKDRALPLVTDVFRDNEDILGDCPRALDHGATQKFNVSEVSAL